MITIQDKAKEHIINLMEKENKSPELYNLRVGVKGGGCSGLSYVMEFDNKINATDEVFDSNNLKVVVDKKSLLYLLGTELQYSDGLNGKGFTWVNPQASRVCGCGESFSL